jgi:membrane protease YdiL (CAAX protease family)
MKIKPSAAIAVGLFVVYCVIVSGVWAIVGFDYDTVADSVQNVREGIVVPIGLGAAYLAIAATVLGWWRPSLFERVRVGSGWMYLAPVAMVGVVVLNLATAEWDDVSGEFLLWLAIGTAFVGFSEEMLTRGLAIVGFRGSMPERWVWLASCAMFAVLHSLNAFFGQGVGGTLQQMVFAFAAGIAFYVTRRITGTILVTMVIHMLWDFSTITVDHSGKDASPGGTFLILIAVVVGIIALVKILKTGDVEQDTVASSTASR